VAICRINNLTVFVCGNVFFDTLQLFKFCGWYWAVCFVILLQVDAREIIYVQWDIAGFSADDRLLPFFRCIV